MSFLTRILPGVALAGAIALCATWLATFPQAASWGLSALTLAIVLGMVVGNLAWPRLEPWAAPGVGFAKQRLLRAGIVLFGLRITLQDIASVGWGGALVDVLMVASTFALAWWAGTRLLRLDNESALLIGSGSAICGAAAVLAAEPVVKGGADKVAVAVTTVVVFGTLGMFGYPLLYAALLHPLGMGELRYGLYVGASVHEVAQVVVAGRAVGEAAAQHAVIAKMMRVMMLAPFLLLLSWLLARRRNAGAVGGAARLVVPWFAVGFVAVAALNSTPLVPRAWVPLLVQLDNLLLATAMAALGLTTHIATVRRAGARPLALAALLFAWLVVAGCALTWLLGPA